MTEYESDPQHRPAPTDAEPSYPSAELPRVERAQSDSPTTDAPAAAGTVARDNDTTAPVAVTPASGAPATGYQPTAGTPTQPAPGQPVSGPQGQPVAGPHGQPGQPVPAQPGQHGQAAPGQHGYPPAGAGGYPGGHWYPNQHSGWTGGGQPGAYGQQPAVGHPGAYGTQPQHAGQSAPPWAVPAGQHNGPRPSRVAKFAGAGVAVLALMLGSGVAGGALALAVDGDGGGITRTYSAAPVINSADLPRIAASVQDSVVSIATDSGEGSGVILTTDGYVLTNNHVVASASGDTVRVVFADGKTAEAEIKGTDPKTDLAVVKANGVSGLKAATFGDSDAMQVGDQVLALGSPLGLQGSVTAGILSARDRTIQAGEGQQQDPRQGASSIAGLLQTDAPINPGNSGGALVNTRGEVIGINTAIATSGQSTGNIGVGFAIPSNKAKDVAGKLQRGEKVSHPSLGVSVNMAEGGGALIAAVTQGSPAEKAGLQRGDVVTRFGDKVINDSDDLVGAVQAGKVGDRVEVHYKRNGSEATTTVTLAETS
ncbi:trypsin-like peptidase domain-containing protein [Micromonospora krabiensis]|uniref:Putative serine protease PepD n=1 Tax=Micromonospora krabiensis TaxID=307121 RepID=A0A1C3NB72_9ACTN|nr:trypsin-like peptidase domain-containing protein [Micromonospora krabiensis]SBV29852.1 putative serine protease PepD [Micromonospora krabiensis]